MKFLRFLLILLTGSAWVSAQDDEFVIQLDVSRVMLDVAVADSKGNPVRNLTREDFSIHEDGKRQEISEFMSTETPYSALLLFDRSYSTQNQWTQLIQAMNRFIENLRPQDRIALAAFDEEKEMLLDWRTQDGGFKFNNIPPGGIGTDFYGALEWAVARSRQENGRKGIIIFTDGVDQMLNQEDEINEKSAFMKVLRIVEDNGAPLYFVAMQDPLNSSAEVLSQARKRMSDLAKRTGGQVNYPKKLADVGPLYERIARELANFYSLTYVPRSFAKGEKERKIEVRVRDKSFKVSQSRTNLEPN